MNAVYQKWWTLAGVLIGLIGCDFERAAPRDAQRLEIAAGPVPVVAERKPPVYASEVFPIIVQYCTPCHDGAVGKAGLVLDNPEATADRSVWNRVAQQLQSATMPPRGEARPDANERETLNAWLDKVLTDRDQDRKRVTVRRLNRAEYNNTIRDLVGLDLRLADDFPADDIGYGFDNIGEVLSIPPVLAEMYLGAAERVMDAAFASPEMRERTLNPGGDIVPLALRKYTPPVRTPRFDKGLRGVAVAVDPELARQQRIYDVLRGFADRGFRRPATHEELTRLLGLVLAAEKDGMSGDESIKLGLEAVLASPQFLFRISGVVAADTPGEPGPANDFELASRLSYFLWSSMPDDELWSLAARGELRSNLQAQVARMLGSGKSRALAENFGTQWLQIRKLETFAPDPILFPEFDDSLRSAMIRETVEFFDSIVREDKQVFTFLNSDYTFMNERLARHYGIGGVVGERFRRVSLAGTGRGGVLTQGSVLAATSNPTRTSPVKRGKWILENVLGMNVPPPPSGVEALEERRGPAGATTLRERMEKHRTSASCAACHQRMDPLGFGLENFDVIGTRRSEEGDGHAIDASGRLPDGSSFQGADELKAVLVEHRAAFVRSLVEKMLTYAIGRGLERSDRRSVDGIVAEVAAGGYRMSALVRGVVESEAFLGRWAGLEDR
jgi:hypothetical protein